MKMNEMNNKEFQFQELNELKELEKLKNSISLSQNLLSSMDQVVHHLDHLKLENQSLIPNVNTILQKKQRVESMIYTASNYIYHYNTYAHATLIIMKMTHCHESNLMKVVECLQRVNESIDFFKKRDELDNAKKCIQEYITLRRCGIKRVDEAISRIIVSIGLSSKKKNHLAHEIVDKDHLLNYHSNHTFGTNTNNEKHVKVEQEIVGSNDIVSTIKMNAMSSIETKGNKENKENKENERIGLQIHSPHSVQSHQLSQTPKSPLSPKVQTSPKSSSPLPLSFSIKSPSPISPISPKIQTSKSHSPKSHSPLIQFQSQQQYQQQQYNHFHTQNQLKYPLDPSSNLSLSSPPLNPLLNISLNSISNVTSSPLSNTSLNHLLHNSLHQQQDQTINKLELLKNIFYILGNQFSNQSRYRKIYREEVKGMLNEYFSQKYDIYKECLKYIDKIKLKDHANFENIASRILKQWTPHSSRSKDNILTKDKDEYYLNSHLYNSLQNNNYTDTYPNSSLQNNSHYSNLFDSLHSEMEIDTHGIPKSIRGLMEMLDEICESMIHEYDTINYLFIPSDREIIIFKTFEDLSNVVTLSIQVLLQIDGLNLYDLLVFCKFIKNNFSHSQIEFLRKSTTLEIEWNEKDILSRIIEKISQRLEVFEKFCETSLKNPFKRPKNMRFLHMHPECPYIDSYTKLIYKFGDTISIALQQRFERYHEIPRQEILNMHKRHVVASLLNDTFKYMSEKKSMVENRILRLNTLQYIIDKIVSHDLKQRQQYEWILNNDCSEYVKAIWGPFLDTLAFDSPISNETSDSPKKKQMLFEMYNQLVYLLDQQKDIVVYNRKLMKMLREKIENSVMKKYNDFYMYHHMDFMKIKPLQELTPNNLSQWINNLFHIE